MNFKTDNASPEETKKREYLKQQHQLRTMTKSGATLSADNMIETLLSKKEIFQKKPSQPESSTPKPKVGPWPVWLTPGREPPLYTDIWKMVGSPNGLADTNKLSPLLMTSRLSTETLGYIWSLSNVTVPGCLTQQELYVALSLVALAQSGYTFANSNVVRQLKEAPLPVLDLANSEALMMLPMMTSRPPVPQPMVMPPPFGSSISSLSSSISPPGSLLPTAQPVGSTATQEPIGPSSVPTITENITLLDISHEPLSLIDSSPKKSFSVLSAMDLGKDYPEMKPLEANAVFSDFQTGDDDFDDFKSADIFSTDMNSLTVLDVEKPKGGDSLEPLKLDKGLDDLFPRCVVKPKTPDLISPSTFPHGAAGIQDFGILDDVPVLDPKNSSHFSPLRDTRITDMKESSDPAPDIAFDLEPPGKIQTAMADLSLNAPSQFSLDVNQTIAPTSSTPKTLAITTPDEDKYSALRMLDSGLFTSEQQELPHTDDFGDFLTADGPPAGLSPQPLKELDDDIQVKCLEACLKLLQEAASIFEAIEDSKTLGEVTSNERGKAYLKEILEVERIGRRIRSTRESCDLISEFENLSKILQPYIEYVKNNHLEERDGPKCGICLCEHGPAHVKYGINHFHAPCANLYLQMVDPILPIAPVM